MSEQNPLEGIDLVSAPANRLILLEKVAESTKLGAKKMVSFGLLMAGGGLEAASIYNNASHPYFHTALSVSGPVLGLLGLVLTDIFSRQDYVARENLLNNLTNGALSLAREEAKQRMNPKPSIASPSTSP